MINETIQKKRAIKNIRNVKYMFFNPRYRSGKINLVQQASPLYK